MPDHCHAARQRRQPFGAELQSYRSNRTYAPIYNGVPIKCTDSKRSATVLEERNRSGEFILQQGSQYFKQAKIDVIRGNHYEPFLILSQLLFWGIKEHNIPLLAISFLASHTPHFALAK